MSRDRSGYEPNVASEPEASACDEAVLYAYLAQASGSASWRESAVERINSATSTCSTLSHYGLFGGLCGLGWTIEHLARTLTTSETDEIAGAALDNELTKEIEALLIKKLEAPWERDFDLIRGLVGFGVYFLERLPGESAQHGIGLIVRHLERRAECLGSGITWRTSPSFLAPDQRELWPTGYYNLGVAHGVPGVIHFLSEALHAGIACETSGALLDGAVFWLLNQQRRNSVSAFGFCANDDSNSRLAWCYGDLGIAAILFQIAERNDRADLRDHANRLLEGCLDWPDDKTMLVDAPLCHGCAGVAHIFNRIYQTEGHSRCHDAALKWFERALEMRVHEDGVAGYLTYVRPDANGGLWKKNCSILSGVTGIALSFLGALTPVEPAWDRMLLLSGIGPANRGEQQQSVGPLR